MFFFVWYDTIQRIIKTQNWDWCLIRNFLILPKVLSSIGWCKKMAMTPWKILRKSDGKPDLCTNLSITFLWLCLHNEKKIQKSEESFYFIFSFLRIESLGNQWTFSNFWSLISLSAESLQIEKGRCDTQLIVLNIKKFWTYCPTYSSIAQVCKRLQVFTCTPI
jgi:hypothetical protein